MPVDTADEELSDRTTLLGDGSPDGVQASAATGITPGVVRVVSVAVDHVALGIVNEIPNITPNSRRTIRTLLSGKVCPEVLDKSLQPDGNLRIDFLSIHQALLTALNGMAIL